MNLKNYPETKKKLGAIYSKTETVFNVWAPTQSHLKIALYEKPRALYRDIYDMEQDSDGVFSVRIKGDLHGKFYTIIVDNQSEVTDPYAISANANGIRSAIIDLDRTNPEAWDKYQRPTGNNDCDAVIYELHIKDFTGHTSAGIENKGKFLGLSENDTSYKGYSTGLDHLVDLGITHVHLMPVYDYLTVDEKDNSDENYNWGYDPEHYNLPEGCYSTDPDDPISRVKELKEAVMAMHKAGIKVVLDVVYNHTYRSQYANFNVLVPNYYYRMTPDGYFSNGSGCGNEFASENPMARRFIVDSLQYWMNEYHIDGFRFDLMGLMDIETATQIEKTLRKENPEILIYGEPWTGGLSTLPENKRVYKGSQGKKGFALFNDDFRNAIKGDNDGFELGFIHANKDSVHSLAVGITGSIPYDDAHIGFATDPCESINYFNSHDNLILWDKIKKVSPDANEETLIRLNKLAFSILFTAQGVPFFHAGNEFLRDKQGHHNTYNTSLAINGINWDNKKKYYGFYNYVKDLIQLRKDFSCLRLKSAEDIRSKLSFVREAPFADLIKDAVVYTLSQDASEDFDCMLVVHNPSHEPLILSIHELLTHMCCTREDHPADLPKLKSIKIERIFDENGRLRDPEVITPETYHLVKVGPISTNVFKFTNLENR
jgi:pullulanase